MTEQPINATAQMVRNFDRVCRWRSFDSYGLRVIGGDGERVYCYIPVSEYERYFVNRLAELRAIGEFSEIPGSGHELPNQIWDEFDLHSADVMHSYRGRWPKGLYGDQWTVFQAINKKGRALYIFDFDVDLQSPVDLWGQIRHAVTVWKHRRGKLTTDPLAVHEALNICKIAMPEGGIDA